MPSWRLVAGIAVLVAACDLKVVNPGPVADADLNVAAASDAIVFGAMRSFNDALGTNGGNFSMCGALIARELYPSGQTGSFACSFQEMFNTLTPAGASEFDRGQLARWLAENAVARIMATRGDSFSTYANAAPILLYVGYANRLLGENLCQTVIDGGPLLAFTIHFARAESAFTAALAIAQAQKNATYTSAAYAGRASVRIWLKNWSGAAADAAQVPIGFVYATPYNTIDQTQSNSIAVATTDQVRRNFSLWNTFYGDNFDQFADPRTPYRKFPATPSKVGLGSVPDLGDGLGPVGAVQYYQQRKYIPDPTTGLSNAPINLSSGHEAQLIIAESDLRNGDVAGAMTIVNSLRTIAGVKLRNTAVTSDSAWTYMKLEKLIELWLQGRAVGERRRWFGDGPDPAAPGSLPAHLSMTDRTGKDRCWPISLTEASTNPHLINVDTLIQGVRRPASRPRIKP